MLTKIFLPLKQLFFIALAALLITGFFFLARPIGLHPSLHITDFDVSLVRFYPWGDMAENVVNGWEMSKGLIFYRDNIVNHLPGVYQYLALFFRGFGVQDDVPSPEFANSLYFISGWAVALWAVLLMQWGLRLLGYSWRDSLALASAWVAAMAVFFDFIMPMSEVMIYYLVFLQMACLVAQRRGNSFYGLVQLLILVPLNLWLGLTVAPSVLLIAALAFYWVLKDRSYQRIEWPAPKGIIIAGYVATVILFAIMTIKSVDLTQLKFWAVDINRGYHISILDNLKTLIQAHWSLLRHRHIPFQSLFECLLFGYFFLNASQPTQSNGISSKTRREIFLIALLLLLLGQWRATQGYKAAPTAAGFLVLLVVHFQEPMQQGLDKFLRRRLVGLSFAAVSLALVGFNSFSSPHIFSPLSSSAQVAKRPAIFDEFNICHAGQTENCDCLIVSVFQPQFFLSNDVGYCRGHYSSFCPLLFTDGQVTAAFEELVQRANIATLRVDDQWLNDMQVPKAIQQHLKEQAQCQEYSWGIFSGSALCHNRPKK